MTKPATINPDGHLKDVLVTAAEAYPKFETACLNARNRITGAFRIFDPDTRLRSNETKAVGETWADLLAHILSKGVDVTLTLSDFDAIARPELHRLATSSARILRKIGQDLPADSGRLRVSQADHPARMGLLPRLLLWPMLRSELQRQVASLNAETPDAREALLEDSPGLHPYLTTFPDGTVAARPFKIPDVLPATHHQKLAVIDGKTLYIGGLDLNDRRYDTPQHDRPADETWHDVQVLLTGPVAQEAERHLLRFEDETEGVREPEPTKGLLRTLSSARSFPLPFFGPRTKCNDLALTHRRFAEAAQDLIYIETQFFRDITVARHLASRGRKMNWLNLVLILPAAPEDQAFHADDGRAVRQGQGLQMKCLRILQKGYKNRLFVGSPAQPRTAGRDTPRQARLHGAPIIYVHSKVAIFDDTAAIVSSANLNGRSMRWDTEAGVPMTNRDNVIRLRDCCMSHWIGERFARHPENYTDALGWFDLASRNAKETPEQRDGFILPFPWHETDRIGSVVPGLPGEAF